MIKFFRNIRQNLLNEGQFSKYLLYAIGEILLVMMGILLALQVNNWNEGRKNIVKEQIILNDLNKNLESNSSALEGYIKDSKRRLIHIEYILKYFENDLPYSDSLSIFLPRIAWKHQINLVSSAYESLKSNGFDVVQSNDLRLKIIELFDQVYQPEIQLINITGIEKGRDFREVFKNIPRGGIANNYKKVLDNDQLYYLLTIEKSWVNSVITRQTRLLEKTIALKEEILEKID